MQSTSFSQYLIYMSTYFNNYITIKVSVSYQNEQWLYMYAIKKNINFIPIGTHSINPLIRKCKTLSRTLFGVLRLKRHQRLAKPFSV